MRALNPFDGRVYLIVGPNHVSGDMGALVRDAVGGGVTAVQLRDKSSGTARMVESARALADVLKTTGVPLLINDRVDVALAADVAGVHLGASDMNPADARRLLGPDKIIGVTVKRPGEADMVDAELVDYASIGGVFETMSKNNPDPPIGLGGLRDLRDRIASHSRAMPVTAIAGIDEARAATVIEAGADGIAVISAVTKSASPGAAARRLRNNVDNAIAKRTG